MIEINVLFPPINGHNEITNALTDKFSSFTTTTDIQIMWSQTKVPNCIKESNQQWIPNHFVPLVAVSEAHRVNYGKGLFAADMWHLKVNCNISSLLKMVDRYIKFKESQEIIFQRNEMEFRKQFYGNAPMNQNNDDSSSTPIQILSDIGNNEWTNIGCNWTHDESSVYGTNN